MSSARSQPDHKESITQYHHRLSKIKEQHVFYELGGANENYFVLPTEVKTELMSKLHIRGILKELDDEDDEEEFLPDSTDIIYKRYTTVLSILLETRQGPHIKDFVKLREYDDAALPFVSRPAWFTDEDWRRFKTAQRHFTPWCFTGEHDSPQQDCVFPFVKQRLLREDGSTADIYDVSLHERFDELRSQRHEDLRQKASPKRYAIKKFKGIHAKDFFKNERRLYRLIKKTYTQTYPQGIIECLDSYETQGGETQCLVLEFASGGSLADLFIDHAPPRSLEDIKRFWEHMFEIFQGLARLHDIKDRDSNVNCIHNDLHPANILLIEDSSCRSSEYCLRYRYAIADLGHATTMKTTHKSATTQHKVKRAGVEFAAPEAHPASEFLASVTAFVTSAVDIFSLGAIFLVAAVWIVQGQEGVDSFARYRQQENILHNRTGTGFHTGKAGQSSLLSAVQDFLQRNDLRRRIQQDDAVTKLVLDRLIVPMMSIDPNARPSCQDLLLTAEDIKAVKQQRQQENYRSRSKVRELEVPVSRPKPDSSKRHSVLSVRHNDKQEATEEMLTVDAVLKKYKHRMFDRLQRKLRPKWHGIPQRDKLQSLENRDFIFLIDDSASMRDASNPITRTFDAMSWIAQDGDDDGIELYFTGSSQKRQTRSTKELVNDVKHKKYAGACPMAKRLKAILDDCLKRLQQSAGDGMKRISIYVLTNGRWEDRQAVKRVIVDTTEKLNKDDIGRRELSIVFVSFANHGDAEEEFMQHLDDLMLLDEAEMDIVDMESHTGDLCKMLLGGLCSDYDKVQRRGPKSHQPES